MIESQSNNLTDANRLCIACGLCCTGHLFSWARLQDGEENRAENLKLTTDFNRYGHSIFLLPCHHWQGQCSVYLHPDKPDVCGKFTCKLLQALNQHQVDLETALSRVNHAKGLIAELEPQIQDEPARDFRQRLLSKLRKLEQSEQPSPAEIALRLKGGALLIFFQRHFLKQRFEDQAEVSD